MFGVERCALSSQMVQRTGTFREREVGEERKRKVDTTKQIGNGDDKRAESTKRESFFALIRVVMHRYKLEDKDKATKTSNIP